MVMQGLEDLPAHPALTITGKLPSPPTPQHPRISANNTNMYSSFFLA